MIKYKININKRNTFKLNYSILKYIFNNIFYFILFNLIFFI